METADLKQMRKQFVHNFTMDKWYKFNFELDALDRHRNLWETQAEQEFRRRYPEITDEIGN